MIRSAISIPAPARAYIDALPAGDWYLFDMSPLDRTGVPAWKAAFFADDPDLAGCAMQQGTGYGDTPEQAAIAAVAECHEEIWARLGLRQMRQVKGSYRNFVAARGVAGVADPLELCLPAGSDVDRDTPLSWVEARRWFSGETVLVPVDLVALDHATLVRGYTPFTALITNGLGAGPTRAWAAAHGLFEVLQRDGNGTSFRALDPGVELTFSKTLPAPVQAAIDRVRAAGIDLQIKFATDAFGFANLFAVGADRDPYASLAPIAMTAGGEACDLDRTAALRKAVLEYAHARARKAFAFGPLELVRSIMPDGYWERVRPHIRASAKMADPRQVAAFRRWLQFDGPSLKDLLAEPIFEISGSRAFESLPQSALQSPEAKGDEAARRLIAAGFDPLIIDYTPPEAAMHASRVIVPRMEVETLSYYRIGERNAAKLLAQDSRLVAFGKESATRRPIRLNPEAAARLGGVPVLDTAAVDARVGDLYPLYREPGAHEMLFQMEPA